MTYSYTQISQYIRCPRRYRYRYLDGWQEKGTRASMVFGRVFEKALAALFLRQDPTEVLYAEWGAYREAELEFSKNDDWGKFLQQGVTLLERFVQDNRIKITHPKKNLQVKILRELPDGNDFVGYIDAIGRLDNKKCLLEWKTTTSRYPDQPNGLMALDPQLICYSWITGIEDIALIAFIRKQTPEIQYIPTHISQQQRQEFGYLVEEAIGRIESAHFPPYSGIRFPQNGCLGCPYLELCLHPEKTTHSNLIRKPGASDLDWLDHIEC